MLQTLYYFIQKIPKICKYVYISNENEVTKYILYTYMHTLCIHISIKEKILFVICKIESYDQFNNNDKVIKIYMRPLGQQSKEDIR